MTTFIKITIIIYKLSQFEIIYVNKIHNYKFIFIKNKMMILFLILDVISGTFHRILLIDKPAVDMKC